MIILFVLSIESHPFSFRYETDGKESLSLGDSLIQEMVCFIKPEFKLNKDSRKHIEGRIKKFPHKIIRRDTVAHFLNTAYAVAYFEFCKHDYKNAMVWVDEFRNTSMPPGLLSDIFNYSSIVFNASNSISKKGRFKTKKDKNSWFAPIKLEWADTINLNLERTYIQFIDSFIDDIPLDLNINTYNAILTSYKQGNGPLEWLNGYFKKGFMQRCIDAGRVDITEIIYRLWNISKENFSLNNYGYLEYSNKKIKVDSTAVSNFKFETLLLDINRKKEYIDSLIQCDPKADVTKLALQLFSQYFLQYRYEELLSACNSFKNNISPESHHTLHNYWALALSNLGLYEDAIAHYDLAIDRAPSESILSIIKLNKGCTLGEMGLYQDAVKLFMEEKGSPSTPPEKFNWNDNLAYIYSHFDTQTALIYYNMAEKYIDSGSMYAERKIRHFCRKAKILESNKFLQREAIEKALHYDSGLSFVNPSLGMAYCELGIFNMSSFDYEEADKNFLLAYYHYKNLSPTDLRLATLNREYAENLCFLGREDEAASILKRQLEIFESKCGKTHSEYIRSIYSLFRISCSFPGLKIDVDSLYNELLSLNIRNSLVLTEFERLSTNISFLLYKDEGMKTISAIENSMENNFNEFQSTLIYQKYEQICRRLLSLDEYNSRISTIMPKLKEKIISGILRLSGKEQSTLQKPLETILNGLIIMGDYKNALELSLFRKGLLFYNKKIVERHHAGTGKGKKELRKLHLKKQELNQAIAFNDTTHVPALSSTILRMEREMNKDLIKNKNIISQVDRNLTKVTKRLDESDLGVDFVKYEDKGDIYYGAFLIDKKGFCGFRLIGREKDILDRNVDIWSFLNDIKEKYKNIYFCPDGVLNSIGIEYFSVNNIPVNQTHKLHRVFHLSDINKCEGLGNNIYLLGVSDHNSPIGKGEIIERGDWTDLPSVKDEIELIEKDLHNFKPSVLFNDEATEQSLMALSHSPISTLHISTHGFYRSNRMLMDAAKDSSHCDYHIARRFLSSGLEQLSGLVLREGNLSWKVPFILEENDDILIAEEIENLEFPGLNLTVLSACDSGLGKVDSEGVIGMLRAFRMAGSRNLICSLSKVDDYWAAQFMDLFYQEAAKGESIHKSFHTAQQWLYHELPDNPEVWSSFILIE
ncbi:MAG: CHAT domain-containing protein [Muribaculaceae bacterium]|nr:CHAT domain-containing protein [Muribaculaceae bacterium]